MSTDTPRPPNPRSKQTRKAVIIVVGAMVAIALVIALWPKSGQSPGGRRFGGRGGDAVVPVLTATAAAANVPIHVNAIGTTKAFKTAIITPQVSGMITHINFKEGEDVEKGALLAEIDRRTYQAAHNQALAKKVQDEALLANSRLDLERYTRLSESNAATKQQADTQRALVQQYEAQIQSDQAAIDNTKATLDYTWVTAPIAGRTGIRQIDEGNVVQGGSSTALVVITQMKPISVQFSVPQQQIGDIRAEMKQAETALKVDALAGDGKTLLDSGTLTVIDNQIDTTTGTLSLKAEFPNSDLKLWPGQFVNIRLLVTTLKDVVTVPSAAVQRGPNGPFVYVVNREKSNPDAIPHARPQSGPVNVVEVRPVSLRIQNDTISVVEKGLALGDIVVTSGFSSLAAGTKVSLPKDAGEPQEDKAAPGKEGSPPHGDTPRDGARRRPANGPPP